MAALALVAVAVTLVAHRPDEDDAFYLNVAVSAIDFPEAPLLHYDGMHGEVGLPILETHYRAQSYELGISESYLLRLAQSYSDFFYHYDAAPVLMVNSEHLNFVDGDEDFMLLLHRIEEMRGPREFFSRG